MRGRFNRTLLTTLGTFVIMYISKTLFYKYLLGAGKTA